jgi:hypothetical protein
VGRGIAHRPYFLGEKMKKELDRTISRQRKWQLKKQALGLCTICGDKATKCERCLECYIKMIGWHKAYNKKHHKVLMGQMREWRKANPTYMREWLKKHPYYMRNYMKAYRAKHPEEVRNDNRKRTTSHKEGL